MPEAPLDPFLSLDSRRLNGWKEIAAYLGRGVRTAQRWEREFGMPVRRIGTNRAESVFAFVEEIDTWLASASAATAKGERVSDASDPDHTPADPAESEPAPQDPSPSPVGPSPLPAPARLKALVWVLGSLTILLAAIGIWRESSPRTTPLLAACVPSSWSVAVDTLTVKDDKGQACWSHQFPAPLRMSEYERSEPTSLAGIEDLDGDGQRETWFIVYPDRGEDAARSAFVLFDRTGHPRWTYRFEGRARFGDVTYAGPWAAHRFFVTARPEGGRGRALWAVSHDWTEYPTVLQRLDVATGRPQSEYWANGYVDALALTHRRGRPVLLAGGPFNERTAPGLAMLDALNPGGSAPAEQDKYRCVGCPRGSPIAFAVLPKPPRFDRRPGSGSINLITTGIDETFVSVVVYFAVHGSQVADAVFRLDENLSPLRVDAGDGYLPVFDTLVRAGEMPPHGSGPFDAAREFLPILRWELNRFVAVGAPR